MTHTPETRTVYRWTEEQLERAGWCVVNRYIHGPSDVCVRVWRRTGPVQYVLTDDGDPHAYLPEPPPPEEMGNDEIGEAACYLRRSATKGTPLGEVMEWASHVVDAALHWDDPRRDIEDPVSRKLHRALRRRPHQ